MMPPILNPIRIIELVAWDFDEYRSRPDTIDRERPVKARELVVQRQLDHSSSALCEEETQRLRNTLNRQQSRLDLHAEMMGLDWSLGVVDLRRLLAFQRRLSFNARLPNMRLRVTQDPAAPIAVHAGSPFFEVAQYAGRWFLRDGYHRAYKLLRAGVFRIPAVIVLARTLEELGASSHNSSPRQSFFRNTPRLSVTSSMMR